MLEFEWITYLRELNMASMALRLTLGLCLGGLIGMERERKGLPAGFRTYMLVCLGAALTMVLSQYIGILQEGAWAEASAAVGNRTDVSRFGAQVINGVGFLAAGTILVTGRQEVRGLPTAAGLWSSACMGLATGAGLYECSVIGFLMILVCFCVFPAVEHTISIHARNMIVYVEFYTVEDMTGIIQTIKGMDVRIFDIDFDKGKVGGGFYQPNAVITVKLPPKMSHGQVLTELSRLESVHTIEGV